MQVNDVLTSFLDYNRWSNQQLSENLSFIPAGDIGRLTLHPFGTVHQTLLHLLGAQMIWYQRIIGNNPTSFPGRSEYKDIKLVLNALNENSVQWITLFEEEKISCDKEVIYYNTAGDPFNHLSTGIALHMVNHGTYHRGQLMSSIRSIYKGKLKPLDFIYYLRETGKKI